MPIESRAVRLPAVLGLLMSLAIPFGAAFSQTPADSTASPAAAPAAAPAESSIIRAAAAVDTTPPDGGWPRLIQAPSGATMVLYQPQVMSWEGQRKLVAMCAVSYTPKGTPVGAGRRPARIRHLDLGGRADGELPQGRHHRDESFRPWRRLSRRKLLNEIRKSLPKENVLIALDRVLAAVDTSQISVKNVKINTEPPPIFFSTKDAILVQFDGEPIMAPISGSSLRYVVNTNWDVFEDQDAKIWYLRNDKYWLQTTDFKKWKAVSKLPESFDKLANDDNWKAVKENIPAKKGGKVPKVFESKKPAELILIDGSPKLEKVEGTKLQWVKNTESDLFRYDGGKKKQYYVLLSGRWFRTEKLEKARGRFATAALPPDFASIPRSHERSRVLASVPGTDEAAQAVLLAQVPRTARVDAKNLTLPTSNTMAIPSSSRSREPRSRMR